MITTGYAFLIRYFTIGSNVCDDFVLYFSGRERLLTARFGLVLCPGAEQRRMGCCVLFWSSTARLLLS